MVGSWWRNSPSLGIRYTFESHDIDLLISSKGVPGKSGADAVSSRGAPRAREEKRWQ